VRRKFLTQEVEGNFGLKGRETLTEGKNCWRGKLFEKRRWKPKVGNSNKPSNQRSRRKFQKGCWNQANLGEE